MELGEVLFYYRQAKQNYERIADTSKSSPRGENTTVESESWAQRDDESYDEDEDVSLESLVDE